MNIHYDRWSFTDEIREYHILRMSKKYFFLNLQSLHSKEYD